MVLQYKEKSQREESCECTQHLLKSFCAVPTCPVPRREPEGPQGQGSQHHAGSSASMQPGQGLIAGAKNSLSLSKTIDFFRFPTGSLKSFCLLQKPEGFPSSLKHSLNPSRPALKIAGGAMQQHCLLPPLLGAANQPVLGTLRSRGVWKAETPHGV